ncbi:VWD domain-containing protein [Actinoplanes sp. NPDC049265]|uniref:VWD domain-containing protein n=1 Tax=Actinoplanes sp. NPDC049265 TaxID=3363902 RepID=UPI00371629F0
MRRILGALGAVLLTLGLAGVAHAADPAKPGLNAWQNQVAKVNRPASTGCYTAVYPNTAWQPTACVAAPKLPMPPKDGARPLVVGNGSDVAARVPAGSFIQTAIGSFENVTNVTSGSGPIGNAGPPVANAYTLQMNTNYFSSTACAGSPNAGCRGWEQFVYANDGGSGAAFIQYWLLHYNTACPGGWGQFQFGGVGDIYCYRNNSGGAVAVPNQPITNLANLSLSGQVSAGSDSVTLFNGSTAYTRTGDNSVNAAAGWDTSEFNVFGYGGNEDGGGMFSFNAGAAMTVRNRVLYGGRAAPTCVATGFTGETNNLSFGPTAPVASQPGPALTFNQHTGASVANCAAAVTAGDVHALTVAGLGYDFQGVGDYTLAEVGPDFEVQARHISGAPTWPYASVNQAIGTRMGKTQVAVCGGDTVVVDGEKVELKDRPLVLDSGVNVTRAPDGSYVITDEDGNSVTVTPRGAYLDVHVGVGTWPTKVRGLLGNPDNNIKLLEARDGTIFPVPLTFDDLYHKYGDSWRVKPDGSLLSPCGGKAEESNPDKPFFARDLDPKLRERAAAVCRQKEIAAGWLEACTLDVAVLGKEAAAFYVGKPPPVLDGN